MNSLQAGLIGVSVLVIALFAAWMWWQSWRSHRAQGARPAADTTKRESRMDAPATASSTAPTFTPHIRARDGASTDALVSPSSSVAGDPSFGAEGVATSEALAQIDERSEPRIAATESDALDSQLSERIEHAHFGADDVAASRAIDGEPIVSNAPTTAGPAVASHAPAQTAATLSPNTVATPSAMPIDDRLNVYALISARDGQAVDCAEFASLADRSFAWGRVFRMSAWESIEDIASGGAVQSLCLALPIATRAGPLTDRDAIEWKRSVSSISDRGDFEVSFGGDVSVSDRAQELDQFLAAADVICVLYLVRRDGGAWSGTRLRGTLEANGFRLQADGRFVYFEVESETPIFSAVDGFERSFSPERLRTENVTALRLVFEASNVGNPVARFDVYRQTLRALARLLEAEIKDSSGIVVGDAEFTALRSDVAAGSTALAEAGIECGSVTAQSLFR